VNHLIDALRKLSEESMDLATSNREPSLFAVAKLLETALVNLSRLDIVWRPITSHLLLVCQHPHLRMRQWGCEALTFLTRQSMQHRFTPPLKDNNRVQIMLLSPLAELCGIPYPDVRQKQLDTVLHILHSSGESLGHSDTQRIPVSAACFHRFPADNPVPLLPTVCGRRDQVWLSGDGA
jgi:hypothetical protein